MLIVIYVCLFFCEIKMLFKNVEIIIINNFS